MFGRDVAADRKAKDRAWRLRIPDRWLPGLPIAVATLVLAWRTLAALHAQVGHPCATLDDSFIHFQYARAIAEGHPLRYQAGAPITSGATSMLWPAMLAPFYLVGFRGLSILWPAWAISYAAQGLLAYEAFYLAKPLAGRAGAWASAAMVLCFSAYAWCSASGMEVMPFAWALARCARRASEWAEGKTKAGGKEEDTRTPRRRWELIALALVTPLLRPEGMVAAFGIAVTLAVFPRRRTPRELAWAGAPVLAAVVTPLSLYLLTGSARSSTAVVKLLPGNPYYAGHALWDAVLANARTLTGTILNGQTWSVEFLPTGAGPLVLMAPVAVIVAGWRAGRRWRAVAVLLLALGMFAPCFYVTFLWNRLRYLWPFSTGWIIGMACVATVLADLATALHPRARWGVPMIAGAFAGALAVRLDWTIDDVANSASGIYRQHVTMARWAKDNLPRDAIIGVNDTGAIAYFSDRKTFDIVGLTTAGEARYWVAGVASRVEHYERLRRTDPGALPTHFIVYPEWFGTRALFGEQLHEERVTDSTILGGQDMVAYVADYSLLGSGEQPWTRVEGAPADALDVADLESEAAHSYELLGARDGEEAVEDGSTPDGREVLDGGRTRRTRERFVVHLPAGRLAHGIARLKSKDRCAVEVLAGGRVIATLALPGNEWTEQTFDVPADAAKATTPLELRARGGSFTSFHYWLFSPPG